jgi:hypothetical protein
MNNIPHIVDTGASVMRDEPVAWARQDGVIAFHKQKEVDSQGYKWFPLYAHPAKTLTDYEIKGVLGLDECWIGEDCSIPDMIAFARAILRKAQEK